ncbi:hybrid sensor histidine kinase/response regulator [Ereboglobus luteus]|nr:two-component regulator propeller domain-containing protein [Ereboglobus luteus]
MNAAASMEGANVLRSIQTRDGYLWFATSIGLVRFDGIKSTTFRASNTPAFITPSVQGLFEDKDGFLWIGTEHGVIRHRDGVFERIGLDDVFACAFAQTADGSIWIGTFGQGLYSWKNGTIQKHSQRFTPYNDYIRTLYVDSADNLWIGSRAAGIVCRRAMIASDSPVNDALPRNTFTSASTSPRAHAVPPNGAHAVPAVSEPVFTHLFARNEAGGDVESIIEYPRGTLWLGSHTRGLFRLSNGIITRFTTANGLTTNQVTQLTPSANGALWVAAGALQQIHFNDLVAAHEKNTTATIAHTLANVPDERILAFTEDHEGSLWLCTRVTGLMRARITRHEHINTGNGLPGDSVKSITTDAEGNRYAAVRRAGIVKITPDGDIEKLPAPPASHGSQEINDPDVVLAASDGSIWSIWQRRLYVWKNNAYTFIDGPGDAFGVFEDSDGIMWVGRSDQVLRYRGTTPINEKPIPIRIAATFAEAADGALYIGSWDDGIYKYHEGRLALFNAGENGDSPLPGTRVRSLYIDGAGRLWAGLRTHGLFVHHDCRWHGSDALSQAVADQVSAMVEDSAGNLWLGTVAGVMWAPVSDLLQSARTGEPVQNLHSLSVTDDFEAAPVWVGAQPVLSRTAGGHLHFATRQGILSINPERLTINSTPPPIVIERVTVNQQPIDTKAPGIRLTPGTRDITIDYAALSYIRPARIAYKHRLAPHGDWVDAGSNRRVSFADLHPGHYTFEVTACNADGVWNTRATAFAFTILPFFYQTLWFRIALPCAIFVALALIALTIYKTRTRRLKRRAAELARYNAELETRIQERTLELTLSNTAKSEFLENISHEIRNPLNGITGLIDQIDDDPHRQRTPAQHDHARALKASARQLNRVFEEILSFSKLEYGYIATHETRFSLVELLTDVRDTFARQAAVSRNTIQLNLSDIALGDLFIGDEAKIRTIIDNFVVNAIKYAPATPITITLSITDHADAAPSDILIEVIDQGPGVSRDEQEIIFKKFARGAAARQSGVTGTGIGLATCAATARHLGGNVGIESHAGRGATFFLRVPLRRVSKQKKSETTATVPSASTDDDSHNHALIVEDQHYNQIVLAGLVSKHGIQPDCATTATEALSIIENRPPACPFDIIFLDIELPGMKGTELARLIRARPDGAHPVIIGTSAHDSNETRARCIDAGMDDFLLKPLRAHTLMATVEHHRAKRQPGNGTPSSSTAAVDAPAPHATVNDAPDSIDFTALDLYARHVDGGMPAAKRIFVENLRTELAALHAAHAACDTAATTHAAHRIRSHTALVGAPNLCAVAGRLERAARQGKTGDAAAALIAEIDQLAAALIAQLE